MIEISQAKVRLSEDYQYRVDDFICDDGQHTAVVGANGSGKSSLAAVIAGEGELEAGRRQLSESVGWVSVAQQQALIAQEKQKDDADILDVVPEPTPAFEIITEKGAILSPQQQAQLDTLIAGLSMGHFLHNAFLGLSTGETRKVLLVKTLLDMPSLLVLDEPWDGLDKASCEFLTGYLEELAQQVTLVLVVNRISEIPPFMKRVVLMDEGRIAWQSTPDTPIGDDIAHLQQLFHLHQPVSSLPERDELRFSPNMQGADNDLVILHDGHVSYDNRVIFSGLNWRVKKGEHWQVVGPNGSGKTCLLSMITGDNPHCYTNALTVFGYKRGSGESIWDIKQHLGIVSNSFHLQYTVNCSVLHVVLSGFYDSIGLYEQPTAKQKQLAKEWLRVVALEDKANTPFQGLSFGDQRLLLIIRAMVKHPTLLILDEPCNGLDEINRLKILALLAMLAQTGESTLLYVNHHSEDKIAGIDNVLDMQHFSPSR
ncbi:molybdate ABC transporter ATP-binding protein ModF [Alteromonas sp. C1M14]|uniref:molybdate ABC transporter ATP-binding protein ModF n=1 Tax=Alteromonas sp. C1M14 TaxID=2841567 RepID=UPI001C080510|nr:molybdate ABC transporter ATP-binding protein ModF [Alteromonas sp. C1M14]MBU2979425.1 molybdate ABC transporter ATP-binding protein ModF [Alteromonas sp. C1M14]